MTRRGFIQTCAAVLAALGLPFKKTAAAAEPVVVAAHPATVTETFYRCIDCGADVATTISGNTFSGNAFQEIHWSIMPGARLAGQTQTVVGNRFHGHTVIQMQFRCKPCAHAHAAQPVRHNPPSGQLRLDDLWLGDLLTGLPLKPL